MATLFAALAMLLALASVLDVVADVRAGRIHELSVRSPDASQSDSRTNGHQQVSDCVAMHYSLPAANNDAWCLPPRSVLPNLLCDLGGMPGISVAVPLRPPILQG